MHHFPLMKSQFPTFDQSTLPAILPEGFIDSSYRNDLCPSIMDEARQLQVFIDFADPVDRELSSIPRYTLVSSEGGASKELCASEIWGDVLKAIPPIRWLTGQYNPDGGKALQLNVHRSAAEAFTALQSMLDLSEDDMRSIVASGYQFDLHGGFFIGHEVSLDLAIQLNRWTIDDEAKALVIVYGGMCQDVIGIDSYEVWDWDNIKDDPQSAPDLKGFEALADSDDDIRAFLLKRAKSTQEVSDATAH